MCIKVDLDVNIKDVIMRAHEHAIPELSIRFAERRRR